MATSRAAALLESLTGRELDMEPMKPRADLSRGRDAAFSGSGGSEQTAEVDRAARPFVGSLLRQLPRSSNVPVALAVMVLAGVALVVWRTMGAPPAIEDRIPMEPGASAAAPGSLDGQRNQQAGTSGGSDAGSAASGPPDVQGAQIAGDGVGRSPGAVPARITVHVAGAVALPGVVQVSGDSRVIDAVKAAGGLRPDADADRLNLAAPLGDGLRIVVPFRGQEPPAEVPLQGAPPSTGARSGAVGAAGGGVPGRSSGSLVNVNRATSEELQALPGVGPATAGAIIAKREKDGPFPDVDSLIEVRGIGEAKLEGLRNLVTVG